MIMKLHDTYGVVHYVPADKVLRIRDMAPHEQSKLGYTTKMVLIDGYEIRLFSFDKDVYYQAMRGACTTHHMRCRRSNTEIGA